MVVQVAIPVMVAQVESEMLMHWDAVVVGRSAETFVVEIRLLWAAWVALVHTGSKAEIGKNMSMRTGWAVLEYMVETA